MEGIGEEEQDKKTASQRFATALDRLCWYYVTEYDLIELELIGALRCQLLTCETDLIDSYREARDGVDGEDDEIEEFGGFILE